jgi:hypothetical protein
MEGVLIAVAALACPLGMGAMMWLMARGARGNRQEDDAASGPADAESLREEHERLGREIEWREQGSTEHREPSGVAR